MPVEAREGARVVVLRCRLAVLRARCIAAGVLASPRAAHGVPAPTKRPEVPAQRLEPRQQAIRAGLGGPQRGHRRGGWRQVDTMGLGDALDAIAALRMPFAHHLYPGAAQLL